MRIQQRTPQLSDDHAADSLLLPLGTTFFPGR